MCVCVWGGGSNNNNNAGSGGKRSSGGGVSNMRPSHICKGRRKGDPTYVSSDKKARRTMRKINSEKQMGIAWGYKRGTANKEMETGERNSEDTIYNINPEDQFGRCVRKVFWEATFGR